MSSSNQNNKNPTTEMESHKEDRRHSCPSSHACWSKLSVAQQASVSSMHNYGYELDFIRNEGDGINAVMLLNDTVIVIDDEGDIDTKPNIHIRKS